MSSRGRHRPVAQPSLCVPGLVVVGGYVHRGKSLPELDGVYVFGDWSTASDRPDGTVLAAIPAEDEALWPFEPVRISGTPDGDPGRYLLGFGQDLDGEMYVLVKDEAGPVGDTGRVLQLVPPD